MIIPSAQSVELPAWRQSLPDYPRRSHFADVSGQLMHYVDEGRGNPVLMIHGNPTWSFYYRHLIAGLKPRFRTIAVDHVGCGLSSKPVDYNYCLKQHVENLHSFISRLDLQHVTLLVHDWGGAIGLAAALRDLDRFDRFVLFNTGAFPPPYIPWRIRACRAPLLGRLAVQGCNLFARAATRMATQQRGGLPAETRRGLLAPYDSWRNRTAIYRFVADIPTRKTQPTWTLLEDLQHQLPRLANHSVKIIWGMRDWCFRTECLQRLRELIPHAVVCQIKDAGHYVLEDAADRVNDEVVNFLDPVDLENAG